MYQSTLRNYASTRAGKGWPRPRGADEAVARGQPRSLGGRRPLLPLPLGEGWGEGSAALRVVVMAEPDQDFLLPPSLSEWLPEGQLAYFISDSVDALDLSAFHARYDAGGPRNQPLHPASALAVPSGKKRKPQGATFARNCAQYRTQEAFDPLLPSPQPSPRERGSLQTLCRPGS
jgi:hypothetical protein